MLKLNLVTEATVQFTSTTQQDSSIRVSIKVVTADSKTTWDRVKYIHLPPFHKLVQPGSCFALSLLQKQSKHQDGFDTQEPRIVSIDQCNLSEYWLFLSSKSVCMLRNLFASQFLDIV
jgi:hypothetical protein